MWAQSPSRAPAPAPVWGQVSSHLELSEGAYAANVRAFRALAGAGRLAAVLKGNAYGHGLEPMLALAHPRVDVLDVITPGEAAVIRGWEKAHGRPDREVLVIGAVGAEEAADLAELGVDVVAADADFRALVEALRAARPSRKLRAQLHVDTGLGREGFTLAQLERGDADFLKDAGDVVELTGVLSHFANTEDVTEQDYAKGQLAAYEQALQVLRRRVGLPDGVERHLAATAASLVLPKARLDVLRVGIGLYGLWPSTETRLSAKVVLGELPQLEPVLSWRCPSQVVKWLPRGSYVGYGCTYRCGADTRVAVLPVGYWDGYPRLASGKAHVLVNGRRCPLLGRAMMNHLIVDVTHATQDERPVVATLLGKDGDEAISAETLAGWAQTIHYEVVTRLGAHLRRVVVP